MRCRLKIRIIMIIVVLLFPYLLSSSDLTKGNRLYDQKKYDDALNAYEKAEVGNPESPYIYFNKGAALYKKQDYLKAKEQFQMAAEKTKDLKIESLANYNIGNSCFMEGERQKDSDLEKAVNSYKESIDYYKRALELDKNAVDAAYNIEVTRMIVKDLLDKLKNEQGKNKEQQEKQQKIVEALQKIAQKQEKIVSGTNLSADLKNRNGLTAPVTSRLKSLQKDQSDNRSDTNKVNGDITALINDLKQQQSQAAQSPLDKAQSHVMQSGNLQGITESHLRNNDPDSAKNPSNEALEEIKKAIEELTKNNQSQNQQNQQQQDQKKDQQQDDKNKQGDEDKKEQAKQDEAQKDQQDKQQASQESAQIIDEEKQNKDKREESEGTIRYYAPDKDW